MINFPISYKRKISYAMGEQEEYFNIHEYNGNFLFTAEICEEDKIKEFVDRVNDLAMMALKASK